MFYQYLAKNNKALFNEWESILKHGLEYKYNNKINKYYK